MLEDRPVKWKSQTNHYIVKSEIYNIHVGLNQKSQEIIEIQQKLNETINNTK